VSAVVAVLASRRGRRIGAPKPLAEPAGAPVIERPLAAAADVAVVGRR
jgi:molybdopterin-guanine dinucleotide biosynthesis protein A